MRLGFKHRPVGLNRLGRLGWLALWAGCGAGGVAVVGHAAEPSAQPDSADSANSAAAAAAAAPELLAHYQLSWHGAPASAPVEHWQLLRTAQHIHLHRGATEERWQRDAAGRIDFERIFHQAQRRVFYSAGELRTLGVWPDWVALGQLIAPTGQPLPPATASPPCPGQLLAQPSPQPLPARLCWDSQLQLPLWYERPSDGLRLTLLHHRPAPAPSPVPAHYGQIDAADLADMAYDPFVRLAQAAAAAAGWPSGHAGHHHGGTGGFP